LARDTTEQLQSRYLQTLMDILSLRRASVGARLAMLSCALVAVIFAAFTFALTRTAGTLISDQVLSRITEKDRSIAAMISLFDKALTAEVGRSMTLFASFLPPGYALDETQKIDIAGTPTPVFKAGDKVLNNDFSIPDQFLAQSGAIATIFARTGDDFVRVTTSLKKQDGSRAIGTLLDRKGPAYGPVAGNKTFTGLATLFGKRYITQYRPITDASGKVIGALFVGVDVDAQIKSVEDGIRQLKIGDTGYYFVLNASNGAERGKLLVHPAAAGQAGDESAAPYKRMLDEKEGQIEYSSAEAALGETGARDKFVSFVTVPEWGWLVGGVAKRDEVMADVIATRNRFILIGFVLVGLFAVVFLIAVRRLVSRPLDEAAKASERFASGDLSVRVSASHERRADEIGRLMQAIDGIGEGLARIVTQVRSASADMTEGTAKIAAGSGEIASRIGTQAASLEETAAATDGVTQTVNQAAKSASDARREVGEAKVETDHSGEVVRQAVEAMNRIEASSRQISQIVGVIDEIAFQTNLLALNAGVEAARAGDAGKGFAVVASEVRALAQRSAESAKEIKNLITGSTQQVEAGVALVGETGEALSRIGDRVGRINELVSGIAQSAQEEAASLQEINTAVRQMDQMTQQNAAMVEQSTAASHSMAQEAKGLTDLISRFQVGAGDGYASHAAPTHHSAPSRAPAKVQPMAPRTKPMAASAGHGTATARKLQADLANEWEEF
jgi:methyl-accepting chemotaxis protein-2 (aspartate sensor receptor)